LNGNVDRVGFYRVTTLRARRPRHSDQGQQEKSDASASQSHAINRLEL
jgi:hypothetical protein